MWQKARVVMDSENQAMVGRTFWARCEPPIEIVAASPNTGKVSRELSVYMNVIRFRGIQVTAPIECIELLPEFAENVEMIDWQDFLAGKE